MKAPEQIFASKQSTESSTSCVISFTEPSEEYTVQYTRADVAQAQVAAAYEAAAKYAKDMQDFCGINIGASVAANIAYNVRALTPTDAKAALDRIKAEAVKEVVKDIEQALEDLTFAPDNDMECAKLEGVSDCIAAVQAARAKLEGKA